MEAVSRLELSGVIYPACPGYGNAIPQGAMTTSALPPGSAADPAALAAMQQVGVFLAAGPARTQQGPGRAACGYASLSYQ
jgi:hypothetical protein